MEGSSFFKRKTPLQWLDEQNKRKQDKISNAKEKYDATRTRGFMSNWRTNLGWLDHTPLADLYSCNEISVLSTFLEIKNERTKSSDKTADETSVTNVMMCTPCREKYYADKNLAAD